MAQFLGDIAFLLEMVARDWERNTENAALISRDAGQVRVRVVHTDEEVMLARSVARVIGLGSIRET